MNTFYWLNKESRKFLERGYLRPGVTPEERIRKIGDAAEKILGIAGYSDKFYDYMGRGWFSLASPIWSNFGEDRGLPISCNAVQVGDSVNQILNSVAEVGMMSKYGAGTAGYFGYLRPRGSDISMGGTSFGVPHFLQLYETTVNVISQSNVRRGSFAAYLPVDHGDIMEFLDCREDGSPIQNLSLGVCIPKNWLQEMKDGDKDKRKIMSRIHKKRFESGYPYIFFADNANEQAPQWYKDKQMEIKCSQLCTEIMLSLSEEESFVCDLSSMNALHYDEWKNTDAVQILTMLLDAVMTEYINKTENIPHMQRARNFAINQRAIGVGVLGWHSLLQSKMIAFESMKAKYLNVEIFKHIQKETIIASEWMAKEYGEPPLLVGYGRRNSCLQSVAPTTSSAQILGQVSQSIEPLNSNYFVKDLAKDKMTYKNPYLSELLKTYQKDDKETWDSILRHGGSVQHLEFLTAHEKDVFKTFGEISQKEIIIQAGARQRYIDQGQSVNLMIHPETPLKEVNELVLFAHESGLKSLYYQFGTNPAQELGRSLMNCQSCQA